MGLRQEITGEMVKAAKGGDKLRLATIRFLLAAVKNKEIDLRRELTDEEFQQVASTLAKQRKESIEQFKKGNRGDLVEKEEKELEIIKEFLPALIPDAQIKKTVEETAREIGASTVKDMGKLMKAVMEKLKGKADGKTVQDIVRNALSG